MRRALVLIGLSACGAPPSTPAIDLDHVAAWKLERAEWERVVTEPFRSTYDGYARAFDAALPALETQIRAARSDKRSRLIDRPHYAGDPALTRGQARTRWALPVQAPARVAILDDTPLDAVFVRVGDRYKAIVGVDQIVIDRTRALDEGCAHHLEVLGSSACQAIGWEIADAALHDDRRQLGHACSIAVSQCGAGSAPRTQTNGE